MNSNITISEDGKKTHLLSLLPEELEALILSLGEPRYRAKQLFAPMHRGQSPAEISNIGKVLTAKLSEAAVYSLPTVRKKLVSAIDGTVKYLFGLDDGNSVESVVMRYKHGNTICISSQVGCRMGCAFCASTIGGKIRDLLPEEMLGQIIAAQKDMGERISNVVMMGIGEPLDNYTNVIRFLKLVNAEDGLNIGYRHISLSTCGLADKIDALAMENFPITLSISLHASDNETRSSIMPVNKKWSIEKLLAACKSYYARTGRRISFEYTLIAGKNDSEKAAVTLAALLNSHLRSPKDTMPIHVNLIPVNPVTETGFASSERKTVEKFAAVLERKGIRATVRRTLGADINASCGQLRREEEQNYLSFVKEK
ncbi:MAG: 23S rRNA (adenine(2503)-C(2))-methyltransferase RlmN [Clostridia bacterium]|nr:23S rRNA (adenine(2503)-C(2))-methyltransferase RlmN [Clostridia bacterium]